MTHSEATRSDPLGRCRGSYRGGRTALEGRCCRSLAAGKSCSGWMVFPAVKRARKALREWITKCETNSCETAEKVETVQRRLKLTATGAASRVPELHSAARWLMEHFQHVFNNSNTSNLMDGHHQRVLKFPPKSCGAGRNGDPTSNFPISVMTFIGYSS